MNQDLNCYEKLGLQRVINANGRMTVLGASTPLQAVCDAVSNAAKSYVVIDDLINRSGDVIASYAKSEAAFVTSSASAGIALCIAGLICKDDLAKVENMPLTNNLPNEVIIQRGHNVNYGAPVSTMIHLGGGKMVEAGSSNKCERYNVENLITDNTICLLYVKSHHCVQKGMVDIKTMIDIAHKHNLPLIIDAAAEEDIKKYVALGADLVIYSGVKAIESITSGFVVGKKEYIEYAKKQYKGIGRAMKVGKEQIMGLLKALEIYENKDHIIELNKQNQILNYLVSEINEIAGLEATIVQDEAGREIYRCQVKVDSNITTKTAIDIDKHLVSGNPSIHCRKYRLNEGYIYFDVRTLVEGDKELVVEKMKKIIEG